MDRNKSVARYMSTKKRRMKQMEEEKDIRFAKARAMIYVCLRWITAALKVYQGLLEQI